MHSSLHYFPLGLPFLLAFFFLIAVLIALIEIGILGYAYEKLGINRRYVLILLGLSLFGSYVNIPIMELPAQAVVSNQVVYFFGMEYVIPLVQEWQRTIVAINVGGAIVPIAVSFYLLIKKGIYLRALAGIAIVAAVVHWLTEPIPGLGIAVPTLVPPLLAAATALLISRRNAPPLAYIAGSLGTLIGADLMNLGSIQGLGAPVVSIGGAGTFDGVFLTGIIAVLLA
ncbi:MAG TPA: DUF1614 domain-containing protein [Terriglobales bacterium]|nr:DUF1614 domain-containing protein [Terriglobales bacterium]